MATEVSEPLRSLFLCGGLESEQRSDDTVERTVVENEKTVMIDQLGKRVGPLISPKSANAEQYDLTDTAGKEPVREAYGAPQGAIRRSVCLL